MNTEAKNEILEIIEKLIRESNQVEVLIEIGKACILDNKDFEAIVTNLLKKDIYPIIDNTKLQVSKINDFGIDSKNYFDKLKEIGNTMGAIGILQSLKDDSAKLANQTMNSAIERYDDIALIIPEIKSNISAFCISICNDYNSLETDEEKARYILKMTIFLSVIALALNAGHEFPDSDFINWGPGVHRSFLTHSALPLILVTVATTILLRTIEQAETKLENNKEALQWTNNLKTILNLTKIGFGSGLTFHLLVDGLVQTNGTIRIHHLNGNVVGSLVPGTRLDDMVYSSIMALISKNTTFRNNKK